MLSTLTYPSPRETLDLLAPALTSDAKEMVTLLGRCTVDYDGRASSTLGLGDRLVILKPDGSLLVHTDEQRTPVNWQPPGCTHDVALDTPTEGESDEGSTVSCLHVRSERQTPTETVDVRFTELFQVSVFDLIDESELALTGSEEDLRQRILEQPDVLEEGFQPLMTERETAAGPVDIYGQDRNGTPTIVELKRRRVGPDAAGQLSRYVDALERDLPQDRRGTVRGILVAPSITDRAERLLASEDLEYRSVRPAASEPDSRTATTLDQFARDNEEIDRQSVHHDSE